MKELITKLNRLKDKVKSNPKQNYSWLYDGEFRQEGGIIGVRPRQSAVNIDLPYLALRNRLPKAAISRVKSRKFLGIRSAKIIFPEEFEKFPGLNPRNLSDFWGQAAGLIRTNNLRSLALCKLCAH